MLPHYFAVRPAIYLGTQIDGGDPMAARSIKDVIASGRLKTFIDHRLIKALGHPVREHVLAVLNEKIASTTEIGREIDLEVPAFYHHVEVLDDLGFLERVESRQRRGSKEHFFRARETMFFDDSAWEKVPASVRSDIIGSHLRSVMDELIGALLSGAFRARATHTTWLPGVFDKLGWQECLALMNETLTKVREIQTRSMGRVAVTGEPAIPATIAMMGFATGSGRDS
jgi:DNA-binding transcriptional ArsR family regulator